MPVHCNSKSFLAVVIIGFLSTSCPKLALENGIGFEGKFSFTPSMLKPQDAIVQQRSL
ncbi:hypothetical protein N9X82_02900 [Polaribacter sp.]|jgi:hypothetical protein|nr:hypothetical protein [Polaribacter sp.]